MEYITKCLIIILYKKPKTEQFQTLCPHSNIDSKGREGEIFPSAYLLFSLLFLSERKILPRFLPKDTLFQLIGQYWATQPSSLRKSGKTSFCYINSPCGQKGVKSILIRYRFPKLTLTKHFANPFTCIFSSNFHEHT